ncbi:hypothetical protein CBW65_07710 [Tumebacillus avium]|uniref:Uncharacterized protein n=2 Tax=Tumebacillus avium TaxID=1903704 RepID=A0A1Y0INT6_9BACL|nr:hypothetical protein CBW65_07710 [Tumebacillus avium]
MFSNSVFMKEEATSNAQENRKVGDTGKASGQYENLIKEIGQNFKVDGYQELIKDADSIVLVPDSVAGPQYGDGGLYPRQKNLIYKNKSNGAVILLSISKTDNSVQGKQWSHSIGYNAKLYNSPEGDYKDAYDEIFPSTDVYLYSFEGAGYSISLTSLAQPMMAEEGILALNQLAQFTDKLNAFLKEKHF